jgi:hypothetical protein
MPIDNATDVGSHLCVLPLTNMPTATTAHPAMPPTSVAPTTAAAGSAGDSGGSSGLGTTMLGVVVAIVVVVVVIVGALVYLKNDKAKKVKAMDDFNGGAGTSSFDAPRSGQDNPMYVSHLRF